MTEESADQDMCVYGCMSGVEVSHDSARQVPISMAVLHLALYLGERSSGSHHRLSGHEGAPATHGITQASHRRQKRRDVRRCGDAHLTVDGKFVHIRGCCRPRGRERRWGGWSCHWSPHCARLRLRAAFNVCCKRRTLRITASFPRPSLTARSQG